MSLPTTTVHPTAIIHPTAVIGDQVEIGPYCIIEEHVRIGNGCTIESHVRIGSNTTLGEHNHVYQGAIIGSPPQDLKYNGEKTQLIIGDHNTIREYATIAKGTGSGGGVTRVGNHNFIMNYVHVAHDAVLGNHIVISNSVQIAGHVEIEDEVTLGGLVGVHQYCKIGAYSMIGVGSCVTQDIVPYSLASGDHARIYGINLIGLRRKGMSGDDIRMIKQIHSLLFRKNLTLALAEDAIDHLPQSVFKSHTIAFLKKSSRGIARIGTRPM